MHEAGVEIPENWEPEGKGKLEEKKDPIEEALKRVPFYMFDLYRLADAGLGSVTDICEKWSMNMVVDALEVLNIKDEVERRQMAEANRG